MKTLLSYTAIATALLVGASAAQAQTCLGTATFAAGGMRAGVEATFDDGASAYGASLAFGGVTGTFASIDASLFDFDEFDESAYGIGGQVGLQMPVAAMVGAQFCPLLQAAYVFGPNFEDSGFDIESNSLLASAGVGFGVPFQLAETAGLVPFGTARLAYGRTSVEIDGESDSDSDTYGLIGLGAGLVLNQRITLRPSIEFPLGLDDSDPTFSFGVAINFGAQR